MDKLRNLRILKAAITLELNQKNVVVESFAVYQIENFIHIEIEVEYPDGRYKKLPYIARNEDYTTDEKMFGDARAVLVRGILEDLEVLDAV